jgi:hypothetical protein
MEYALGNVHHLQVSGVLVLAVVIAVMAFWREIVKAVIALLMVAVIIGLATSAVMLLHYG